MRKLSKRYVYLVELREIINLEFFQGNAQPLLETYQTIIFKILSLRGNGINVLTIR